MNSEIRQTIVEVSSRAAILSAIVLAVSSVAVAVFFIVVSVGPSPARAQSVDYMQKYIGGTVERFMLGTGITPSSYFDVGTGRVFVASRGACTVHVFARSTQKEPRADSWQVYQINRRGPCGRWGDV